MRCSPYGQRCCAGQPDLPFPLGDVDDEVANRLHEALETACSNEERRRIERARKRSPFTKIGTDGFARTHTRSTRWPKHSPTTRATVTSRRRWGPTVAKRATQLPQEPAASSGSENSSAAPCTPSPDVPRAGSPTPQASGGTATNRGSKTSPWSLERRIHGRTASAVADSAEPQRHHRPAPAATEPRRSRGYLLKETRAFAWRAARSDRTWHLRLRLFDCAEGAERPRLSIWQRGHLEGPTAVERHSAEPPLQAELETWVRLYVQPLNFNRHPS